ncbi:MAG: hypothetical protein S4CHLAM2_05070 [Chlamydiales bacterium]|nr:hypothetical protein [Chlamydiales bacterium]
MIRTLTAFFLLCTASYAVGFEVPNGTVETTTQTLSAAGDTGLIEAGGTISVDNVNGVESTAADTELLNNGLIVTTGTAIGVSGSGAAPNFKITNNGTIKTNDANSSAIETSGANAQVINNSFITTGGGSSSGIDTQGDGSLVLNRGTVSTVEASAPGLRNEGVGSTVINTGLVTTELGPGFFNAGTDTIMTNTGTISGGTGEAIANTAQRTQVFNRGSLLKTGDDAAVVSNTEAFFQVINTGPIRSEGINSPGISSNSDGFQAINSGSIVTEGTTSIGIDFGVGTTFDVANFGFISTIGNAAHGIRIAGNEVLLTNTGAISVVGTNADAVSIVGGADVLFTNRGTVVAQGTGGDGVSGGGTNIHVVNSGTIVSTQANALNFAGASPTLTLLRGSNLQGAVQATNPLALNVQNGLNLALTLGSGSFDALNIDAPFAQVGNTIAVLDPAGFAMQSDILADLSDTFLGGVYRYRTAFPCRCFSPCCSSFWIEGLGSYRERDKQNLSCYTVQQAGFRAGFDIPLWFGDVGIFGGLSYGEGLISQRTQKTAIRAYVGGLTYEWLSCDRFFGAAVVAGYSKLGNTRYVMNNLAAGGVDHADACPRGLFLSPEITYAQAFPKLWCSPILNATARYAGFFFGNYAENGSIADLSVNHRRVQLATLRGEVSVPVCICFLEMEPYIGVAGRFQVDGQEVETRLLGEKLQFEAGLPKNIALFVAGFRGSKSVRCFELILNVEANFDSEHSCRIFGEGGIGFGF